MTQTFGFTIKIASRGKRIKIHRGSLKANAVKSYTEVTDSNYEVLGLLDAFKDIKEIPDTSVVQSVKRLSAILENIGYKNKVLDKLIQRLHPLSTIRLGLKGGHFKSSHLYYLIKLSEQKSPNYPLARRALI